MTTGIYEIDFRQDSENSFIFATFSQKKGTLLLITKHMASEIFDQFYIYCIPKLLICLTWLFVRME